MEEIHEFVTVGMTETGVNWSSDVQRDSYIEMVEDFMMEVAMDNKIEQWDVRCDGRNNKATDMNNGKFVLEVMYKQRNCLNTTVLRYDIADDDELDLDIDFN
jgi:hypothetical protein